MFRSRSFSWCNSPPWFRWRIVTRLSAFTINADDSTQTTTSYERNGALPPTPQLPLVAVPSNVVINGNMPILDGDQLIPHPTPTTLTTISYLPTTPPCFNVQQTPAWWCTIGDAAGRELPTGHRRQLIATTKSVFINGRRSVGLPTHLGREPCHYHALHELVVVVQMYL